MAKHSRSLIVPEGVGLAVTAAVSGALLAAERSLIGAVSSGCPASSSNTLLLKGELGITPCRCGGYLWVICGRVLRVEKCSHSFVDSKKKRENIQRLVSSLKIAR